MGGGLDSEDDFGYPLPVTIICELLVVPREDVALFRTWVDQLILAGDPGLAANKEVVQQAKSARTELRQYMGSLIDKFQQTPVPGLMSAILHDTTRQKQMTADKLISSSL